MRRGKAFVRGAALCLLAMIVIGCIPQGCTAGRATRDDIVGLWIERQVRTQAPGDVRASLEFDDDGTFEARDIQQKYFVDSSMSSRVSGRGRWHLEKPPRDPFYWQVIVLEFAPIPQAGYTGAFVRNMYVSNDLHGNLIIYVWSGDESNRDEFMKAAGGASK